jgi:TetR/AcrR family transcriptional regulator, regulator of autoinduction and epiphytic fitness
MALSATKNRQIIDAALAEFVANGFHGARMDAIAERAQVSKRTVYKHFASKEALFGHLITVMRSGFSGVVAAAFDPTQPIDVQLRRIGQAQGELFTSRPFMKLVRLLVAEAVRDPTLAAFFPDDEGDAGALAQFMTDAHHHGAISADNAELAARQFRDLVKGRAFWPALIGQKMVSQAEMSEIVEQAIAMFLNNYGAHVWANQQINQRQA